MTSGCRSPTAFASRTTSGSKLAIFDNLGQPTPICGKEPQANCRGGGRVPAGRPAPGAPPPRSRRTSNRRPGRAPGVGAGEDCCGATTTLAKAWSAMASISPWCGSGWVRQVDTAGSKPSESLCAVTPPRLRRHDSDARRPRLSRLSRSCRLPMAGPSIAERHRELRPAAICASPQAAPLGWEVG